MAGAEERPLPPLSRDEAARLAADVVGSIDADLAEEITLAAGYWPGAVERIAIQRVGERSARRVVAAVEQAEPASRRLTAARGEVAAGVRDLARIRARQTDTAAGRGRVACPYKGLAPYEQADAPLFFGRDDLVAQLCARLVDTAFVAVVGASGAGKSSLVRAGLMPALADGVLPGLVGVPHFLLAPGAPLPVTDGAAVVVVDQFEEIFIGATGDAARDRYLDELTALAARPGTRIVVVMRSDFVGACAAHPRLAQLVGDGIVLVGPMRADEVRSVVEGPAQHVGLRPEPALAAAIVSDVESAPGALPLLSTALVEVWQRRSGATLTVAAYHRSGGVFGAVARLGEAAYASLDEPTQAAARRLLLRLAETGEGGNIVRRRVPRTELGDDPPTGRALDVLVARRLLTAGERGVEVTHEALLTHWPRLAGWLADDERGRALRRHLAPAALDWNTAGRPDTELYRGARLAAALDWAGERLVDLTGLERDFLATSRDYADRELREEIARADRQLRASRRLRAALAVAVALLIVASGAVWIAVDRQRAATDASRQSLARRLGALALVTPDLDRSLLLAVQAVRTHDDWETRGDLLAVLSRSPQALRQVRGASDQGVLQQVALTRDGSTVVAGGVRAPVRLERGDTDSDRRTNGGRPADGIDHPRGRPARCLRHGLRRRADAGGDPLGRPVANHNSDVPTARRRNRLDRTPRPLRRPTRPRSTDARSTVVALRPDHQLVAEASRTAGTRRRRMAVRLAPDDHLSGESHRQDRRSDRSTRRQGSVAPVRRQRGTEPGRSLASGLRRGSRGAGQGRQRRSDQGSFGRHPSRDGGCLLRGRRAGGDRGRRPTHRHMGRRHRRAPRCPDRSCRTGARTGLRRQRAHRLQREPGQQRDRVGCGR